MRRLPAGVAASAIVVGVMALATPGVAAPWRVVAWNNLGMHCVDADFSVLSILPPYNVVVAQVIDGNGRLVTTSAGITVTYEAVADPAGSINTSSQGKSNFWQFAQSLFGLAQPLPEDTGIAGALMPGPANQPRAMAFEAAHEWFIADGVPITPYDDARQKNPYPMMRVVVRDGSGAILATTSIVLPVSDEMDCTACHASGSGNAARPAAGWVNDTVLQRDYRLNILRLHDERRGTSPTYLAALAAAGYSATGLYATATGTPAKPILCASCHASNALGTAGATGVPQLTTSVHLLHAHVVDPASGLTLDSAANREACYRCHPGSTTRCLRGAMGSAVAADGTLAMQCQSCHGNMSAVGASGRQGWLSEPTCQGCHTGTASSNNGQIRYTTAFEPGGQVRQAVNQTFATNVDTPAAGLSLFRFSTGHGGLQCEACHGSTHAEYPSSHANDNVESTLLQGHVGMLVECTTCHAAQPSTTSGGPHGMHPIGQAWVNSHPGIAEGRAAQCQPCHGIDYRGTVLSRVQGARSLSAFGTKSFWRGSQIGCYTCHNGPSSDHSNPNHAPVASNASAATTAGIPVAVGLRATDADGNTLVLRVVSQAGHGTVGLAGTQATYRPEAGWVGTDAFTFAAWDGQTDSNLATVTITVAPAPCTISLTTQVPATSMAGAPVSFQATVAAPGCNGTPAFDWDFGDGTTHGSVQSPAHPYATAGAYTWRLVVSLGSVIQTATGSITVTIPPAPLLTMAFISHGPGLAGTQWRSDLAVVNPGTEAVGVDVTFRAPGGDITVHESLPASGSGEWLDATASLFQIQGNTSGAVLLSAASPLSLSTRSSTPYGTGTVGQSYPGVAMPDTIGPGQQAVLPQLRQNADYRTNVGFLNLAESDATVTVMFHDAAGRAIGATVTATVPARRWVQLLTPLVTSGAGESAQAWAEVTVTSAGGAVWAYASVIDNHTGDPATVLMLKR